MAKTKGAELMQAMPQMSEKDKEYETKNHLSTLHDAADIMADPEKMQRVHKLAGRRNKALKGMIGMPQPPKINSLDDLKKKAYAKQNDDGDMDQ